MRQFGLSLQAPPLIEIVKVYSGGDFQLLTDRVREAGVTMDEKWWRKLFKQCFRALEFMHQQAMMHCDIKELRHKEQVAVRAVGQFL
eukprot:5361690-Amphidinium_carterae.1